MAELHVTEQGYIASLLAAPRPSPKRALGLFAHFHKVSCHERHVLESQLSQELKEYPGLQALVDALNCCSRFGL